MNTDPKYVKMLELISEQDRSSLAPYLQQKTDKLQRSHVILTLEHMNFHMSKTSESLGISRRGLNHLLQRYEVEYNFEKLHAEK